MAYFGAHAAHAAVVQAKFFERVARGRGEKRFETFDTDGTEGVVAQIEFHDVRTVDEQSARQLDLGSEGVNVRWRTRSILRVKEELRFSDEW